MERQGESTMATTTATIIRRCDRLEQRLERIEQHLGWAATPERPCRGTCAAAAAAATAVVKPPPAEAVIPPWEVALFEEVAPPKEVVPRRDPALPSEPETLEAAPPAIAHDAFATPAAQRIAIPVSEAISDQRPPLRAARPAPSFPTKPPTPSATPRAERIGPPAALLRYESKPQPVEDAPKQSAWEQLIGLKLAGWVGAIVLVIGAGLGIKYLYDIGFFTGVSPAVWLSLLSVCAFGLIGAGEYVYRTINKISATGLFGAGIAGLFLISYAGHGYYGLYQRETAFTLMALSTLVGAGVAMRAKLVSIAALSLIGGLLAPLVLSGDSNLVVPFLSYLLMLQVVALVLSWWGGTRRWWGLRGLSLAGTCLWTATILGLRPQPWGAAMGFTILYAGLYHLELILSAWSPRRAANDDDTTHAGAGVTFSIIVTAALIGGLLWIFAEAAPVVRGTCVTMLAAATLLTGLVLRRRESTRALAYGYRVQSALLVLLAVPVTFSGPSKCFGWAAVALALAAVGGRLKDRATRYTAVVAWGLAVVNLIVWAGDAAFTQGTVAYHAQAAAAKSVWLTLFGEPLAAWTIVAWSLALIGHAVAWLVNGGDDDTVNESRTLSAVATALFAIATVAALPPIGATGVLLAYAWVLAGADLLAGKRLALLLQAMVVLALAAGKWAVIDTLAQRLAVDWSPARYLPVFNPLMLTGVAIAGSIVAMYRLRRDAMEKFAAATPVGVMTLVVALITVGLTLEVDRVVGHIGSTAWPQFQTLQLAWTVLWTASAVSFLWLYAKLDPAARQRETWRSGAWFLTGLLVMKFVLVDTLFWWWGGARATPTALFNMQTLAAIVVAGGLLVVHRLVRTGASEGDGEPTSLSVGFAAVLVLVWAGTLEIDRLVASGVFPGLAVWPKWQLRQFAWSAWWTVGAVGYLAFAARRDLSMIRRVPLLRALSAVPIVLAIKYLLLDTMYYRVTAGPAPAVVAANIQSFCGALIFGALLLVRHLLDGGADDKDLAAAKRRRVAGAIGMFMLLWLGSLEIDRAFVHSPLVTGLFAQPRVAEQVALSIFWSAFAIGCVFAGFRLRIAGLRYFGLALFALTLVKVGLVDLQGAQRGYRILSFMGLGGLLLVTSVLYGKLSPRLLREEGAIANDVSR